jgi:hypothetical protein
MRHFRTVELQSVPAEARTRDFLTLEDDVPAAVVFDPIGARERTTSFTDVKHETTDDN